MTYFKLDIPKVNESVSRYKEIKNNCLEDIGIVYRGLGYTESAWNDPNAYTFIEKTKRDKYKISEYFGYIDSLYNEINQFKANIDDLCSKQGYRRSSITLKFDDSDIDECKKYLNNAVILLNDSLNKINITSFKPDFEYINLLYNLRSEIKVIKNSINQLIEDISSFTNSINNEIYNSRFRLKRIGDFDLNLKVTDYKWRVTDIETKTIEKISNDEYSNIGLNKIENSIRNYEVSGIPSSYNFNNNQINLEETDKVNGLNNNLNNIFATENKIITEETEKISGLNSNLNGTIANQNDIKLNPNEKVEGLNRNVNQTVVSQNNIDTDENERINGLNNNLNNVSTEYTDVNINTNDRVEGLNNNLNNKNINSTEIQFDGNKNIKDLNTNIYESKVNNVDMNLNINKNINVSNNISTVKVNEVNIDTSNIMNKNYDLGTGINIAEVKTSGINTDINRNVNLDTNIKRMESLDDLDRK